MDESVRTGVDDPAAVLRSSPLWEEAPEESILAALEAAEVLEHADEDRLIAQGEAGRAMHVIAAGEADVIVRTAEGSPVRVARLGPGEICGEMSLLTGEAASADVVAHGEVTSLTIDKEGFQKLIASDLALVGRIARVLSHRLRDADVEVGEAREKEETLTRFLHMQEEESDDELIGKSPPVRQLRKDIAAAAATREPILLRGEPGTGKHLVARLIHEADATAVGPMLRTEGEQVVASEWGDQVFGAYGVPGTGRSLTPGFLELARGGTLLIEHVGALPLAVQHRLAEYLADQRAGNQSLDVRVITTVRDDILDQVDQGKLSADLADELGRYVVDIPPLRNHKRDVPEIAQHFLKKHAQRLEKEVTTIEDAAIVRLVSYDYKLGNISELEDAIRRAVILTDEDSVRVEHVFVGPPPRPLPGSVNLFKLLGERARTLVPVLPKIGRFATATVFLGIFAMCFLGGETAWGKAGTLLVWSVWWPVLVLSFFLLGRVWCAVCPMSEAGTRAQAMSGKGRRIPTWLKNNGASVAMAGLVLIVWAEEVSGMRHSPVATGILLACILAGAVTFSVIYPRRTWCRHVCPLGGLAGVCSTSGMVELRPTFEVCSAKCTGHACFKGDEHVAGCPMFNHVMFVDSNEHCVLCMNCVQSCPNESPQLNIRIPGRELWTEAVARPDFARFVTLLGGLVVAMILAQVAEAGRAGPLTVWMEESRALVLTGLLVIGAALPVGVLFLLERSLFRKGGEEARKGLWRAKGATVPLVLAAFVTYQLAYIPGLDSLRTSLDLGTTSEGVAQWFTLSVLNIFRATVLTGGLVVSLLVLLLRARNRHEAEQVPRRIIRSTLAGLVCLWGLLMMLTVMS